MLPLVRALFSTSTFSSIASEIELIEWVLPRCSCAALSSVRVLASPPCVWLPPVSSPVVVLVGASLRCCSACPPPWICPPAAAAVSGPSATGAASLCCDDWTVERFQFMFAGVLVQKFALLTSGLLKDLFDTDLLALCCRDAAGKVAALSLNFRVSQGWER